MTIEKIEKLRLLGHAFAEDITSTIPIFPRKKRPEDSFIEVPLLEPSSGMVAFAVEKGFAGVDVGRRYDKDTDQPTDENVLRVFLRGFSDKHLKDFEEFKQTFLNADVYHPEPNSKEFDSDKVLNFVDSFAPEDQDLMHITAEILLRLNRLDKERHIGLDSLEAVQLQGMDVVAENLLPGQSVSHVDNNSGTITGIFYSNGPEPKPVLMSCWHVLHGDGADGFAHVMHPGGSDNGDPERDQVAEYLLPGPDPKATGDVAVAALSDENVAPAPYIYEIDGETFNISLENSIRLEIADVGQDIPVRSRALGGNTQWGVVDGVGTYFVFIDFLHEPVPIKGFRITPKNQNSVAELSSPGDSGTMRIFKSGEGFYGAGVHVGGEISSNRNHQDCAIASHLPHAMEQLQVSFTVAEARQRQPMANPGPDVPVKDPSVTEHPQTCPHCGESLTIQVKTEVVGITE